MQNSYALINRALGPYEEIFVLTFKAHGPNAVKSMCLELQNKFFPYGQRSWLIRAFLYTHTNKLLGNVSDNGISGVSMFLFC